MLAAGARHAVPAGRRAADRFSAQLRPRRRARRRRRHCRPATPPPGKTPGPKCPPYPICGPPGTPPCSRNQIRVRRGSNGCEPSCQPPNSGRRQMLSRRLRRHRRLLEFKLPAGETAIGPSNFCCRAVRSIPAPAARGRAAAALWSTASVRRRSAELPARIQRQAALRPRLCPDRRLMLPREPGDLHRRLLSGGRNAQRPQQKPCHVRSFHKIPIGPLCCASGLIPTASGKCCSPANVTTSGKCCPGPVNAADRPRPAKSDSELARLRRRLYQDAGRNMLQQRAMSAPTASAAMSERGLRARRARDGTAIASRPDRADSRPENPTSTHPPALPARALPARAQCARSAREPVRRCETPMQRRASTSRRPLVRPAKREHRDGRGRAEGAAGLSAGRDANPRRQVRAECAAGQVCASGEVREQRRQVPAECAAGMSGGRDANPRASARPAGRLSAGLRAQSARRYARRRGLRCPPAPVPKSLRRLRSSSGGFRGLSGLGGPGEFARPAARSRRGKGGEIRP